MTKSQANPDREIPEPIKRAIRQRCGFGCVVCGLPLYEYDHMTDWATVREHIESEITLLCDKHHKEKTNGLLPVDKVREANAAPYNLRSGVTAPYDLHFLGNHAEIHVGPIKFEHPTTITDSFLAAIDIDCLSMLVFTVEDDHLLLNISAFDESNTLVLCIYKNQLILNSHQWDIQLVGKRLIIREAPGKILLDILFDPPHKVFVKRGRFLRNGVEVLVGEDHVFELNSCNIIFGPLTCQSERGLAFGDQYLLPPPAVFVGPLPRTFDRNRSLRYLRRTLKKHRSRNEGPS